MDPYDENAASQCCECKTYPLDANIADTTNSVLESESSLSLCDNQYFNIKVECTNQRISTVETRYNSIQQLFSNIPKQEIQQQINMILSSFNVPSESRDFMTESILSCAEKMANITHKNHKILRMRVVMESRIWVDFDSVLNIVDDSDDDDDDDSEDDNCDDDDYEDDDYGDEGVVEESMDMEDEGCGLVPASESSIEGLETVKVEQQEGSVCDCAICFEDFNKVDLEAIRMPCLHLFHKICIVNWLHKANSCPLCRFKMPTNSDDE